MFKKIYLTPEGEALAGNIAETVDQAKARMMEALSAEETLLLKTLLKKLRKAWEDDPQEEEKQ